MCISIGNEEYTNIVTVDTQLLRFLDVKKFRLGLVRSCLRNVVYAAIDDSEL